VITTGDSGTVTNTMLAGSIANNKLDNSTISGISLGSNLNTLTLNVSGTGLSGNTTYNGSAAATFTVTSNATNANTGGTIVARDASGNFSAGTITATLSGTASNANTAGGLSVHSGRNNQANQIVRTDGNGYLQTGYINSDSGYNENNNSSPDRVWGSNAGGDSYLRAYRTSALSVGTATNATNATNATYAAYVANDAFNARFHWSGQSGQPTWLWGSNNGYDYYVWNPSEFNVASVGGNTPQTSGFNGGLAVRYSGDARLDSNYFVGYGTVGVAAGNSNALRRRSADGYFLIEGSRGEYKRDIEQLDTTSAAEILMSLNPVKFNWKDEFDGPEHENPLMQEIRQQHKEYGFIVEDVAQSSPELVTYLDDNEDKTPTPMMWQQNGVIALLVRTVQNLMSRVEYLESLGDS
jgi:hypothetical protein